MKHAVPIAAVLGDHLLEHKMRCGWSDGVVFGRSASVLKRLLAGAFWRNGAAQESNLPTVGLPRLTGFEDQLGHRARPLRRSA